MVNTQKMPKSFELCLNSKCKNAENCLRSIVAESKSCKSKIISTVNPVYYSDTDCMFFKSSRPVLMAYGMIDSFHEIRADDIAAIRKELVKEFNRCYYYRRRNGKRPITPEDRQKIENIFRKYGYEAKFDRYEEEIEWQ